MRKSKVGIGCAARSLALALALFLVYVGMWWIAELPYRLAVGWAYFLSTNVPQLEVYLPNFGMAAGFGVAFVWGLHSFLKWFVREKAAAKIAVSSDEHPPTSEWKPRWTLAIAAIVLFAFVAGTAMIGVAHQTIWLFSDETPILHNSFAGINRRIEVSQDLDVIDEALKSYTIQHEEYPAAATGNVSGRLLHGWQARLLPFVDTESGQQLHARIDFAKPWNDPFHADVFRTVVPGLVVQRSAPSLNDDEGYALTTFAGNSLVFGGEEALAPADITDGLSTTILVGEISTNLPPWGRPGNSRDPTLGLDGSPLGFGSEDGTGVHMLMADGAVRFLGKDIDPEVLRALATPNSHDTGPPGW